jgi:heme/copper-type cytochrome/quinol oxidase subunit 2
MSHTTTTAAAAAPRRSAAQWAIVAVLAILGILALVVAILFIAGTANSIHILSGSVHHGHHPVRLTVSLVAAVLLLGAAGYFVKATSKLRIVRPFSRYLHGAGAVTVASHRTGNSETYRVEARQRR